MNREQGIKFLLETGKFAHIMKEIFQGKKEYEKKSTLTFRKVSQHRLEFQCNNKVLDKITLPSSKLCHSRFKMYIKRAAML